MSIRKKVLALAIALSCSSVMSTTAFAAASTEEAMPLAEGLISQRSLSGTYGYNTLMIDASTIGADILFRSECIFLTPELP